jgi:hypothetical protein
MSHAQVGHGRLFPVPYLYLTYVCISNLNCYAFGLACCMSSRPYICPSICDERAPLLPALAGCLLPKVVPAGASQPASDYQQFSFTPIKWVPRLCPHDQATHGTKISPALCKHASSESCVHRVLPLSPNTRLLVRALRCPCPGPSKPVRHCQCVVLGRAVRRRYRESALGLMPPAPASACRRPRTRARLLGLSL